MPNDVKTRLRVQFDKYWREHAVGTQIEPCEEKAFLMYMIGYEEALKTISGKLGVRR